MAWTYEQKFNDLNTADLNGQDSWSGAANYDVSTTNPYEGTKCVTVSGDGTERTISRVISGVTSGTFYVSMRSADTDKYFLMKVYTGTSRAGRLSNIGFNASGNITYFNGSTEITLVSSYTANTWYRIGIEIDSANTRYKINVNNGAWSGWVNYNDVTGTDEVTELFFEIPSTYSGEAAFDYISPNYSDTTTTTPHLLSSTGVGS